MNVQEQINQYITGLPEPKRSDMQALHHLIQEIMPSSKLWFMDGKDIDNKTVSNPNIGYGFQILKYADGKTRDFFSDWHKRKQNRDLCLCTWYQR